jgi:signal transduction histidine kinase
MDDTRNAAAAGVGSRSRDRLLQPFQRLGDLETVNPIDDPAAGLGLGLSIVAAIADVHGAELQLRPEPGGGLVAEVRFPAAVASAAGASPASLSAHAQRDFP